MPAPVPTSDARRTRPTFSPRRFAVLLPCFTLPCLAAAWAMLHGGAAELPVPLAHAPAPAVLRVRAAPAVAPDRVAAATIRLAPSDLVEAEPCQEWALTASVPAPSAQVPPADPPAPAADPKKSDEPKKADEPKKDDGKLPSPEPKKGPEASTPRDPKKAASSAPPMLVPVVPPAPPALVPAPPDVRKPLPPAVEFPSPNSVKGKSGTDPSKPMPTPEFPSPNQTGPPRPPAVGPLPLPPAAVPFPTPQDLDAFRHYVEGIVDPNATFDLVQGKARLIRLRQLPREVHVSGDGVVTCVPVNGREIALHGKHVGTAVLHLTFAGDQAGADTQVHFLVRVFPDLDGRGYLEPAFRALAAEINRAFPGSHVELRRIGDAVLVTGQARDPQEATQILHIVVANTPWANRGAAMAGGAVPASGSPQVVNMLRIGSGARVLFKVAVVEMSHSAAQALCASLAQEQGPLPTAAGPALADVAGAPNLAAALEGSAVPLAAPRAARTKLAGEAPPIALFGQPATLLGGGQFPVPVVHGGTAPPPVAIGLYGIELHVAPAAVEGDRVRVAITATAAPELNPLPFRSTVDLRSGQTFAVTGLVRPAGADREPPARPARLPFFGRFAGCERPAVPDQEVVLLIMPELVAPAD